MHGAHKSRKVPCGPDHSGYKNGGETKEAKSERSEKSEVFRYLIDLGNHCSLFYKQIKPKGRAPSGYLKLDLTDPEQMSKAIQKTIKAK